MKFELKYKPPIWTTILKLIAKKSKIVTRQTTLRCDLPRTCPNNKTKSKTKRTDADGLPARLATIASVPSNARERIMNLIT